MELTLKTWDTLKVDKHKWDGNDKANKGGIELLEFGKGNFAKGH